MKILERPLILITTLMIVSLLLSWRYFNDDDAPSSVSSGLSNYNQQTDTEMLALAADNTGEQGADDQPPAAEDVLVQRIPGDNNHLLLMAYYSKENYSNESFTIENGYTITFKDDGRGDDKVAGDGLYTAKIPADVAAFRNQANSLQQQMRAKDYKPVRYINRQRIIDPNIAEYFDLTKFEAHQPVSITGLTNALSDDFPSSVLLPSSPTAVSSSATVTAATNATAIPKPTTLDSLKKNSVLITNLAVVEDSTRTWNMCSQKGTVNGAWTFGTLMRQLASKSPSKIATDAQLSDFTKAWLNKWAVTQVINGDSVKARTLVNDIILSPWLSKSGRAGAPAGQLDMRFAPFKLIAIVNRFDLRAGRKFGLPGHSCGEGRFVFCLISSGCTEQLQFTAIFEYGINKPNTCDGQHAWAQQWFNLKNFPLGSAAYNQALQKITDQFTKCGTNTSRPNQSSLDQIRTNEVALSPNLSRWEFREFILDSATGVLKENTVAQTPADKYDVKVANADVQVMVTYVNNHKSGIISQTNITPLKVTGAPLLGGGSRVNGTPIGNPTSAYFWDGTGPGNASTFITDDNVRFNFSLQTCSGCHAGETQTFFTHIDPAFYGKEAGLSGFLSGKAGRGGAIDFDNDPTNGVMSVKDAALRPSTNPTIRTFNDIDARAKGLKGFVSTTCGTALSISSQLMFQPTNMVH